jgi:hypothetical protein
MSSQFHALSNSQRPLIGRRGSLRPRKSEMAGAEVIRSSLDARVAPPTAVVDRMAVVRVYGHCGWHRAAADGVAVAAGITGLRP